MQDLVINIGISEIIIAVIVFTGTLITIAWRGGARFSKLEVVMEKVEDRITRLEGRIDNAFISNSPISLQEKGTKLLEETSLKSFIDSNLENLFEKFKASEEGREETSYDIQEGAFKTMDDYELPEDLERELKEAAFNEGTSMDVVRRIGGIYLRDRYLEKKDNI